MEAREEEMGNQMVTGERVKDRGEPWERKGQERRRKGAFRCFVAPHKMLHLHLKSSLNTHCSVLVCLCVSACLYVCLCVTISLCVCMGACRDLAAIK